MTKRFGFHSNPRGAGEIKDFSISIDFKTQKHRVLLVFSVKSARLCQTLWKILAYFLFILLEKI